MKHFYYYVGAAVIALCFVISILIRGWGNSFFFQLIGAYGTVIFFLKISKMQGLFPLEDSSEADLPNSQGPSHQ